MPDHLTRSDLERISRLHAKSTPGPWGDRCTDGRMLYGADGDSIVSAMIIANEPLHPRAYFEPEDAAFIAAAHQDVPRIIADLIYWRRRWASLHLECMGPHVPDSNCTLPECAEARAILEEKE